MRARDFFLALLIIAAGVAITAHHRGVFKNWQQSLSDLDELYFPYSDRKAWGQGENWLEVERFNREVEGRQIEALIIDNPNGLVTVTGGKHSQVRIETSRYGRGKTHEDAFPLAQRANLKLSRLKGMVKITVTGQEGFWRDGRLDLRITTPASLKLQVKTASGAVVARNLLGGIEATTVSGRLEITDSQQAKVMTASGAVEMLRNSGPANVRSVSGPVTVRQTSDSVYISTVSGRAEVDAVKGDLSAATVSGDIAISNHHGAQATIETTSGRITASLSKPASKRFSAQSLSGNIDVVIPPDANYVIALSSRSGRISSNLPLYQVERSHNHLRGRLGAGRGQLSLTSITGAVAVNTNVEEKPAN